MYINNIKLNNFRCFESLSFDFNQPMTVLVGENGAGKTALLEGLRIGVGAFFLGLPSPSAPSIAESDVRRSTTNHQGVVSHDAAYPSSIQCSGSIDKLNIIEWSRSLQRKGGKTTREGLADLQKSSHNIYKTIIEGSHEQNFPLLSYYSTQRTWTYKKQKDWKVDIKNRIDGYIDCLDPASSEKHMSSWLRNQAYASAQDGIVPPHIKSIERAVCDCLSQPNKRALKFVYNIRFEQLEIHWEDEKQNTSITPFQELSDGYRNMTAMVADLAWRASILNPHLLGDAPSQTSGVVLIDEVDLHLHPRWQRRVLGDLLRAFPQVQFVVTTHSPQVISSAKPEWIRILTDKGVVTPTYAQGLDSNRILSDLMGVSSRPEETERLIDATYTALENGKIAIAQDLLDDIRARLGPLDPASLRLGYALHEAQFSPPQDDAP